MSNFVLNKTKVGLVGLTRWQRNGRLVRGSYVEDIETIDNHDKKDMDDKDMDEVKRCLFNDFNACETKIWCRKSKRLIRA
tara:strand:- start:3227 stop:3466 length:240 start_codon:yes stop_codon:yes gene_type:complete